MEFGVYFLIVLLSITVLVLSSLIIDAVLRRGLTVDTHINIEREFTNTRVLIVYLPGILSSARSSCIDLIDLWRRYGDVMLVEYGDERFNGSVCVHTVAETVRRQNLEKSYRRIVFIGASMGGLLAYDVIRQLVLANIDSIDLIVLDAPTSNDDFHGSKRLLAPLLRILFFGQLWNRLNLVAKISVQLKAFKLSFWRDQLVYIMSHGAPKSGSLKGLVNRLVYVRSTRDHDTVRPETSLVWLATTPIATVLEVDSTHVGFAESPMIWREAFEGLLNVG